MIPTLDEIKSKLAELQEEIPTLRTQEGGGHYKDFPIQPMFFSVVNGLGFVEGEIIAHICRHALKDGPKDLKKVIHYATHLLEVCYGETYSPSIPANKFPLVEGLTKDNIPAR